MILSFASHFVGQPHWEYDDLLEEPVLEIVGPRVASVKPYKELHKI